MIVVPIKGDKIETKDGVTFTVLAYTNYRDKGPSVYVEHTPEVPSDAVYFFDIQKINGKTVEMQKGPKVFKSLGPLPRKVQLPQPGDDITWRVGKETYSGKLVNYKLHKRGDLAKGLLFVVREKTGEEHFVRMTEILDIDRSIGNDLFTRQKFLTVYADYKGT